MAGKHKWTFFRAGGFDQVKLETGADLLHLDELDQTLWVALACPTGGLEIDSRTLALIDTDKNGRTSVLEAFAFAKREVGVAYEREGIILTEHPILSDNGEKTGTQTPAADGKQGRVASIITMGSVSAEALPADPKLRALYVERRDLERRIEALKLLKDSMEPAKYASEL